MPDITALSENIIVEEQPDGLNLQLVDQEGRSMFPSGEVEPHARTRELLTRISPGACQDAEPHQDYRPYRFNQALRPRWLYLGGPVFPIAPMPSGAPCRTRCSRRYVSCRQPAHINPDHGRRPTAAAGLRAINSRRGKTFGHYAQISAPPLPRQAILECARDSGASRSGSPACQASRSGSNLR